MRTIKFRAKSFEREWVYGDLHLNCKFPHIHTQERRSIPIDTATIGQFTGLSDRAGREIYEDDILRVKEYDNLIMMRDFDDDPDRFEVFSLDEIRGELRCEIVMPVEAKEINFAVGQYYLDCFYGDMRRSNPIFDIEVIGNIHDKYLLEGGEQ